MRGANRVGRTVEAAFPQQQAQQADEQAAHRRHGDRQDGERAPVRLGCATARRDEQRVIERQYGFDETDGDHGDDAADDKAEHSEYGNTLEHR